MHKVKKNGCCVVSKKQECESCDLLPHIKIEEAIVMEEDVHDGIGKLAPRKVKDIEGIQAEYLKFLDPKPQHKYIVKETLQLV